ncbi:MAG: acyl-CoA dehydrogenase [Gemmatimonadetes bacterium]|nr:acyl-CoA dehydrogenase [Gemmatimonadota bacterium]
MSDPGAIGAFLEPHHGETAGRVRAWCDEHLRDRPEPADDDAARTEAREVMGLLGAAGWFRCIGDQDFRTCGLVREALADASPLADAVFALQALGSVPMILSPNEARREEWVPRILDGTAMSAFAMTEPGAGSDVASLATTAVRDGDGYVLNGTKTFISNGGLADVYTVFAQADPARGKKGITAFVVPADTPGFRFVKAQVLSSPHPLGEIAFEDCRVPVDHRLGEEGDGLRLGLATLDRLRATVAAAACGMAGRALHEAVHRAKTRKQFGQPLAAHQLVQQKIARMATELTASRLLTYQALWKKDGGASRVSLESGMAKAYATEAAQRIVDDAVQILGGRGVLMDHPVDRLYRSVRALRIYEGTTEIQQLIIAGHVLADGD